MRAPMKEEYKMMAWSNKPITSSVFRVKKFIDLYRKERQNVSRKNFSHEGEQKSERIYRRVEEPSTRL